MVAGGPTMARSTLAGALASFLLIANAVPQETATATVEPTTKAERKVLLEWKTAQGKPYWYRLPKQIDAKNPPDLVVMLHGTGLDHRWSFWNYPILGDFRARDIVVSPDALTPGAGGTFNFVQGPKDGDQIADLIKDFQQRFPIGRVFLYGHSQGAFFTYWFAGEHPELVDGMVAHAGNVLSVKHSKLARQKVAIGILHGKADAVVPVDCAYRTEKIYREQGYEKVKLEVVEGLTETSGHWPLPVQVASMFEWLDQVSTQSAAQAMRTAASELQRPAPDLGVLTEQVEKATKLLPKASDDEKKELPAQIQALKVFLGNAAAIQLDRLALEDGALDGKAAFGAWAIEFLRADRAFANTPEWKKATQRLRDLRVRHDKLVEKALKGIEKPGKDSRATARKVVGEAFLAQRRGELLLALERDDEAESKAKAGEVAAAVTAAEAAATEAAPAWLAPLLKDLMAATPALFPSETPDAGR
jgi:predicted esterase